jgi:hypothetical protein
MNTSFSTEVLPLSACRMRSTKHDPEHERDYLSRITERGYQMFREVDTF